MDPKAVARLLALLCVLLAAICIWLAVTARRAQQEASCWRAFVEEGEHPPEGDCRRL